jgi:hypothetical protein
MFGTRILLTVHPPSPNCDIPQRRLRLHCSHRRARSPGHTLRPQATTVHSVAAPDGSSPRQQFSRHSSNPALRLLGQRCYLEEQSVLGTWNTQRLSPRPDLAKPPSGNASGDLRLISHWLGSPGKARPGRASSNISRCVRRRRALPPLLHWSSRRNNAASPTLLRPYVR